MSRLQQEVPQKKVGVLRRCRHTTPQEAERSEDGRGPSKEGVKCYLTTLVDFGVTADPDSAAAVSGQITSHGYRRSR
ncbi:hypothetical protein EYF80_034159 [Liparis tanakae]|uniref:Uncharacterized protein n=1 Tax=Liparis tanakae TaxID=230148 RepID=A0A4Z2GS92_9TELE|nr:hypothetical protein EYF80_034159 [Liparis tanakae]